MPGWERVLRVSEAAVVVRPSIPQRLFSREELDFFRVAGSNLDRGRCWGSGLLLSVVPAVGCVCGWGHVLMQGRLAGRPPLYVTHTEPSTLTLF